MDKSNLKNVHVTWIDDFIGFHVVKRWEIDEHFMLWLYEAERALVIAPVDYKAIEENGVLIYQDLSYGD